MFRSSVLAILLAGVTLAQTPAPTVVRWQRDAAPQSDWRVSNGNTTLLLHHDGLSLSLWLDWDLDEKISYANLSVSNNTDHRIEFAPSQITLAVTEPDDKRFIYLEPDKLAASVRKKGRLLGALAVGAAGMATQESRTRGTVTMDDGSTATIEATTTTPDRAAQSRTAANVERGRQSRAATAANIIRRGLLGNTLMPGEYVVGAVYFAWPKDFYKDANKKWLEVDLRVPLGNYIFEFPYYVGSRRKWKLSVLTGVPPLPEDEESIRKK
jgi:hypothetical protein